MKKFLFGLLLGGLIVGGYNFIKNNPNNEYVIKAKTILHVITTGADIEQNIGIANPASVYCEKNGGTLEIKNGSGGQYGVCNFLNGSSCEERAYMRGECSPVEENKQETPITTDNSNTNTEIPTACTMEYAPVCAKVQIQCIKAPCDPIEQTFGNKCMMDSNKLATFVHEGECIADKTQCPTYTPPSPEFCSGGVIVEGGIDANGCKGHPTCKK